MQNKGEKSYLKRTQKDYSLAFKLQVVEEVERGLLTYKESQKQYGIQGRSTVLTWLRKHGRLNWHNEKTMKRKSNPQQQIRELEKQLKRLKAEKEIFEIALDVAKEDLGIDIRKKYLAKLSEEQKRKNIQ